MNDLTSLRDLGHALDQDLRGPAPGLRHRVLTDLDRPRGRTWRAQPGRAMARRGLGLRLAVTGGLAVVLAGGLLAASTLRLWGESPAASAEAADILHHAAAAAGREPTLTARPSQFIYLTFIESAAEFTDNRLTGVPTYLYKMWLSVTGTRAGLERAQLRSSSDPSRAKGPWQATPLPGCRDGRPVGGGQGGQWQTLRTGQPSRQPACVPVPAYPAGLPTNAQAMLAYLYQHREGQNPPAIQAFITAGDLIRDSYLRPAALAALFNAVTQIPGVTVARHAVNALGQHGIAVQQTFHGVSAQLIFNPRTYAFIGERQVVVSTSSGLTPGTVLDSTAILGLGVVDHVGQLP